jgi:hypothetical protein
MVGCGGLARLRYHRTNPVTSVTYVTSGTAEPIGALKGVTLGSTDKDSFTFDPNTGRPATYTFTVNN